jgi:UDP-3-O-[3-hydroxymyristoyl] glucosamine N-acyltransferase
MVSIENIIKWYERKSGKVVVGSAVDRSVQISGPESIDESTPNGITFIGKKYADQVYDLVKNTKAQVIIIDTDLFEPDKTTVAKKVFLLADNPKKLLLDICEDLLRPTSELAESISPNAVISDKAVIGERVRIAPFVIIEDNVSIGDCTTIGSNTVVKANTVIGKDVRIGSCNVIGGEGFGYVKNEKSNEYEFFTHYGGVKIGNNVHIGNNTCIDRGSLKDTIIEDGVKIDNLVHIAHNVRIGENSLVIACSMIAGSVEIGENCWVAPATSVINNVKIGDGATLGLSSSITKDVEEGQIVVGNPAMDIDQFKLLRGIQKEAIKKENKGKDSK